MTDPRSEEAGAVVVYADGEGKFEWLQHFRVRRGRLTHLAALPRGMTSGLASVAIVGRLQDGSYAFLETSLRLVLGAMTQWESVYGVEADGRRVPRPNAATRERINVALLLSLIREREGSEVTFDVGDLNALMQDATQAVEMEYGADGKTITLRAKRSD